MPVCPKCGGTGELQPYGYRSPEARAIHKAAKVAYWDAVRQKVKDLQARGEDVIETDFTAMRGKVYFWLQQLLAYHNHGRMSRGEANLTMLEFDPWGEHSMTPEQIRDAFGSTPEGKDAAWRLFVVE